jgi:hypothetical protein
MTGGGIPAQGRVRIEDEDEDEDGYDDGQNAEALYP